MTLQSQEEQTTLPTQIESFLKAGLYLKNWSPRTARTYATALQSLAGVELTKSGLEKWVVGLTERGLTPGGVNVYTRTVNSFLSWLREEGTEDVPIRASRRPRSTCVGIAAEDLRLKVS